MKICFILPGFSRTPIGGYKIVYEYANRLVHIGNEVTIVSLNENKMKQFHLPEPIRKAVVNAVNKKQPEWFDLDKKIKKISSEEKEYLRKLTDCDVVFATGIQTVKTVKDNFPNAIKCYLIQGYENWGVTEKYLHETYSYGFCNIVVSSWLKEIVDRYSKKPAYLLKNPIDTEVYKVILDQKTRRKHSVGLLYHTDEIKGVKYALNALYKLKDLYEDLTVEMFGMFARPKNIPSWINYKRSASPQETVDIYNKVQVFLCASIEEGYGLTGLEAMACGACLVSTAYKGVLEYASDGYNALLSEVKDENALVMNMSKLFENEEERIRLSQNGVKSVKDYSWRYALDKLTKIIDEQKQ